MQTVFLLLGSNLNNRLLQLQKATQLIETLIAPVIKSSSVYETQSWGKTMEPDYLNQVISVRTSLAAQAILKIILDIENLLGRKREEKWGSRLIDIDILFYGQLILNEHGLKIPHPELHKRRFTLEPLTEIAPGFIHPVINKNILTLKSELKDNLNVKRYNCES